jgi:hypothetical protein
MCVAMMNTSMKNPDQAKGNRIPGNSFLGPPPATSAATD